jgi:hypothetical protein
MGCKKQRVRSTHPNATRLNNFLLKELAKANDKALEMETKGRASAKEVKTGLKPVEETKAYFVHIANRYLEEQRLCGNYEVAKTDLSRLKRFYEFTNGGKLTFPEISVDLLHRYVVYLKQAKKFRYSENKPAKPLSERTITNHLIIIRTIYNRAIKAKLASRDNYPFGAEGKVSIKFSDSSKMGLNEAEIKSLEEIDLSGCLPILNTHAIYG